ncbi:MAG: hypothetical protein L0215_27070 [Gemmataceae bacterium]|nr:hypothetical protein [Gemmataceae bacterium]
MKRAYWTFGLALVVCAGCSKSKAYLAELFNLLNEASDCMSKIVDDESAKTFLDNDGKIIKDRFTDFKKRIDEFARLADGDDKRAFAEEFASDYVRSEMVAAFKNLDRQKQRLESLAEQLRGQGRDATNVTSASNLDYFRNISGGNKLLEDGFSKQNLPK